MRSFTGTSDGRDGGTEVKHDENCARSGKWYREKECREFSTDGTAMGALIAHQMGTTDEEEIKATVAAENRNAGRQALTGMAEEQADWEEEVNTALGMLPWEWS